MSKMKIIQPHHILIEKVAGEFAAIFWEAGRSSGMTSKYKNARAFARANLEKFIPKAVEHLIDLLGRDDIHPDMKDQIYQAIQERTNDEQVNAIGKMAGLPEFEKTILYKADNEKPKPIIINTPKYDPNSLKGKSSHG